MSIIQKPLTFFRIHKDESNTSSATPEKLSRYAIEIIEVLRNFLNFKTVMDFKKVFPQYNNLKINKNIIPFYIGQEALKISDSSYKLFGILTIFELMGKYPDMISKEISFTTQDLKNLTGSFDFF